MISSPYFIFSCCLSAASKTSLSYPSPCIHNLEVGKSLFLTVFPSVPLSPCFLVLQHCSCWWSLCLTWHIALTKHTLCSLNSSEHRTRRGSLCQTAVGCCFTMCFSLRYAHQTSLPSSSSLAQGHCQRCYRKENWLREGEAQPQWDIPQASRAAPPSAALSPGRTRLSSLEAAILRSCTREDTASASPQAEIWNHRIA